MAYKIVVNFLQDLNKVKQLVEGGLKEIVSQMKNPIVWNYLPTLNTKSFFGFCRN